MCRCSSWDDDRFLAYFRLGSWGATCLMTCRLAPALGLSSSFSPSAPAAQDVCYALGIVPSSLVVHLTLVSCVDRDLHV